jgi:phosphoglycerate dehydrogenase-like enzyme
MNTYAELLQRRLPDYDTALARTPYQEIEYIRDASVATGVEISEDVLSRAEKLDLFVVASSGYEHLPLDVLSNHDVTVANASGIHAPGIAEQVLGYLLMFTRNIHEGIKRAENQEWRHYQAREFQGSTVTIVGLGAIGHAVVDRLQGFKVNTVGVRYSPKKGGPTDEVIGFDDRKLHDVLARTDYLVLSTLLSDVTEGLIGHRELATLPPSAVLVNVSRGGVVDTDALLNALQNQELAGAALDVTEPEPLPPDHPLWRLQNVFITPHMGGHTPKHWERLADVVARNVQELEAGNPDGLVNQVFPR